MSKSIEEVLARKPKARPRIYAYSIDDAAHTGLLKVGQTTRNVKQRVAEQVKTAAIKNYTIVLDEPAEREDGSIFSDHHVRAALDELADFGRPSRIALAVLIDRGGRELPIHADIVGRTVTVDAGERVDGFVDELDGRDEVVIASRDEEG